MTEAERLSSTAPVKPATQASPNTPVLITIESVLGMSPKAARLLGWDVPWRLVHGGHAELIEDYWLDRFDEELPSHFDGAWDWISTECGSTDKFRAIFHLHGEMAFSEWLTLLGEFWTDSDNVGVYKDQLIWILREYLDEPESVIPELMNAHEKEAFARMPEEITIYRGCGPINKLGLSWSLSREIATRFPFSRRYHTDQPLLLTATICKDRAAALKLGRTEQEVIVIDLPEGAWTEESLSGHLHQREHRQILTTH
jgi:hypothetical protein